MQSRLLGHDGLVVSALGLGTMGMSAFYGPTDEAESAATIERALELGVTFFDTADMYGQQHGQNEELVGRVLRSYREQVVIATKFGFEPDGQGSWRINGRPDYVRAACEASLRRLNLDYIDLYYQHRVDPNVPIEETVGAMSDLVHEGKVRYLGLSEVSLDSVQRAHLVHPIAAVQTEYSLWSREPEEELLPGLKKLGIGFVAYSPLGRGFLSKRIKNPNELAADDFRRQIPRYQGENFNQNLALIEQFQEFAASKGLTSSQLALAWLLAQGEQIVPIPGTKRRTYLEENLKAADLKLSQADLEAIEELMAQDKIAGQRYNAADLTLTNL